MLSRIKKMLVIAGAMTILSENVVFPSPIVKYHFSLIAAHSSIFAYPDNRYSGYLQSSLSEAPLPNHQFIRSNFRYFAVHVCHLVFPGYVDFPSSSNVNPNLPNQFLSFIDNKNLLCRRFSEISPVSPPGHRYEGYLVIKWPSALVHTCLAGRKFLPYFEKLKK